MGPPTARIRRRSHCTRGDLPGLGWPDKVYAYDESTLEVCRFEPNAHNKLDKKTFRQRHADPAAPDWFIWTADGCAMVPYKQGVVRAAIAADEVIYIAEGEKNVETLLALGLAATTFPMGANKWFPEVERHLIGARVCILRDNDEPGLKHQQLVASKLARVAKEVRTLDLPGLKEKGDVTDYIEMNGEEALDKFLDLVKHWSKEWDGPAVDSDAEETAEADPDPFKWRSAGTTSGPILTGLWRIKGLLPSEGVAEIFGRPGGGKSFVVIDMGIHVAAGLPWRGRRVQQCDVLYMSMEAGAAGENRIHAWLKHHAMPWPAAFHMSPVILDLRASRKPAEALVKEIRAKGWSVGLIIVDTLAKALCGGNENTSEDMGKLIANCEWLAHELRCLILIVHHSGKDSSRGARGHSSLLGAISTEIELRREKGEPGVMVVTKQRDGSDNTEFGFNLEFVPLGHDEDGDEIGSCVAIETDAKATPTSKQREVTGATKVALDALARAIREKGEVPSDCGEHIPRFVTAVKESTWREYHYEARGDDDAETRRKHTSAPAQNSKRDC